MYYPPVKLEFVKTLYISNNNTDENGRRCVKAQRQTYTTIDKINIAEQTSEL